MQSGERYVASNADVPYLLGPGDVVEVTVYGEESLTGQRGVNTAGEISLPLIGDVPAAGKTVTQLAEEVRGRYANGYLQLPSVAVQVAEYRPIYVLGEVNTPGKFPFVPGMTASAAVASAGGFSPRANRKYVFIDPEGAEGEEAYLNEPNLQIHPGDTIRVGERYF